MPERSWSSFPFRAFPSSGAVAPLDAPLPSCRSPASNRRTASRRKRRGTAADRAGVTPRPREISSRPSAAHSSVVVSRVRLQGLAPRSESVASPRRLGQRRARCSPGVLTSTRLQRSRHLRSWPTPQLQSLYTSLSNHRPLRSEDRVACRRRSRSRSEDRRRPRDGRSLDPKVLAPRYPAAGHDPEVAPVGEAPLTPARRPPPRAPHGRRRPEGRRRGRHDTDDSPRAVVGGWSPTAAPEDAAADVAIRRPASPKASGSVAARSVSRPEGRESRPVSARQGHDPEGPWSLALRAAPLEPPDLQPLPRPEGRGRDACPEAVAKAPAGDQRRARDPKAAGLEEVEGRRLAADPAAHPGADPKADAVGEATTGGAPPTRRPVSRRRLVTSAVPAARRPSSRRRHEDRRLERCRRPAPTRRPASSGSDACRCDPRAAATSVLTRLRRPESRRRRPLLPMQSRHEAASAIGSPRGEDPFRRARGRGHVLAGPERPERSGMA
jgi:hypothetical protein